MYTKFPIYDPIIYCVHEFLCGHKLIEREFTTKKPDLNKAKLEDTSDFKRSIFTRNVMQCCALLGAVASHYGKPFHFILHPYALQYTTCLIACLFLGHIIGMTVGLCIASRVRYSLIPKDSSDF